MWIIDLIKRIFKRNKTQPQITSVEVENSNEMAFFSNGRPIRDKNGEQFTKTEYEYVLRLFKEEGKKSWDITKDEICKKYNISSNDSDNSLDIYSDKYYGKIFSNSHLSWDCIDEKHHKAAKVLIDNAPRETGIYIWKRGDVVEYIGQSINLKKRTAEHLLDGNKVQRFDRIMRENVSKYTIEYVMTSKEELDETEINLIKLHSPKFNIQRGGSSISTKINNKDLEITQGINVNRITIKGEVFSITGSFYNKKGEKIPRSLIIKILEKLGGEYKIKARSSEVWLVGKNPGKDKMSVIDASDRQVDSPYKIIGFKDIYNK